MFPGIHSVTSPDVPVRITLPHSRGRWTQVRTTSIWSANEEMEVFERLKTEHNFPPAGLRNGNGDPVAIGNFKRSNARATSFTRAGLKLSLRDAEVRVALQLPKYIIAEHEEAVVRSDLRCTSLSTIDTGSVRKIPAMCHGTDVRHGVFTPEA